MYTNYFTQARRGFMQIMPLLTSPGRPWIQKLPRKPPVDRASVVRRSCVRHFNIPHCTRRLRLRSLSFCRRRGNPSRRRGVEARGLRSASGPGVPRREWKRCTLRLRLLSSKPVSRVGRCPLLVAAPHAAGRGRAGAGKGAGGRRRRGGAMRPGPAPPRRRAPTPPRRTGLL